jgi:hypothetical protein
VSKVFSREDLLGGMIAHTEDIASDAVTKDSGREEIDV